MRGADGIMYVHDSERPSPGTLTNVLHAYGVQVDAATRSCSDAPQPALVIFENKCDDMIPQTLDDVLRGLTPAYCADEDNDSFVATRGSARTGCNVSDAFAKLIEMAARSKIRALQSQGIPLGAVGGRSHCQFIKLGDDGEAQERSFSDHSSCSC
jgi:hypothetical protein